MTVWKRDPIHSEDMFYYDLPVNPEPWKVGPLSMGRRRNGAMYPSIGRDAQLYTYQESIRECLEDWNVFRLPNGVKFRMETFFWRRQDEYQSEGGTGRTVRKHVVDLTNMVKGTEDALQTRPGSATKAAISGVLFENDRDCVEQANHIMAQGPNVEPRLVIGLAIMAGFPSPEDVMTDKLREALGL